MTFPRHGDVSELVEGARLEIVYTYKTRILGSNPSISAIYLTFNPNFIHPILQEFT